VLWKMVTLKRGHSFAIIANLLKNPFFPIVFKNLYTILCVLLVFRIRAVVSCTISYALPTFDE